MIEEIKHFPNLVGETHLVSEAHLLKVERYINT